MSGFCESLEGRVDGSESVLEQGVRHGLLTLRLDDVKVL